MEAEKKADEIIEMFTKGIKEKAVITNPVRFAAKQCALNHVNGIIENINAMWLNADNEAYDVFNSSDNFYQEVKTIIENK